MKVKITTSAYSDPIDHYKSSINGAIVLKNETKQFSVYQTVKDDDNKTLFERRTSSISLNRVDKDKTIELKNLCLANNIKSLQIPSEEDLKNLPEYVYSGYSFLSDTDEWLVDLPDGIVDTSTLFIIKPELIRKYCFSSKLDFIERLLNNYSITGSMSYIERSNFFPIKDEVHQITVYGPRGGKHILNCNKFNLNTAIKDKLLEALI